MDDMVRDKEILDGNATNDFSEENKLGEGGFGVVYKGTLQDGQEIAVKRLSKSSSQGIEELRNEVVLVAQLHHRNLIPPKVENLHGKRVTRSSRESLVGYNIYMRVPSSRSSIGT
ncbi:G-type lectin S-receptor-like serine/threonine-protein kinase [Acorus calamus]|uniref:G-type lectin S-receptor-like serine/threonine-protein kinase n=1 Tax=Acorus calamus TaxID=4465 RepID=A0AAV9E3W1_ACOCL|nr:G-type lectin S-receptor-like serine/threonine-protein kinase [Acorus calamus]